MTWRCHQFVQARFTWIVTSLLCFFQFILAGVAESDTIFLTFGLCRDAVAEYRLWSLFTYGFLHGDWVHLATNVVILVILGTRLEWIVGARKVAEIFFLSVALGGVFHVLLVPGEAILVGASGAAMGFLLFFCSIDPYARVIPLGIHAGKLGIGVIVSSLFFAVIHPDLHLPILSVIGETIKNHGGGGLFLIGNACHLGGCVAGLAIAKWQLRLRHTKESIRKRRAG